MSRRSARVLILGVVAGLGAWTPSQAKPPSFALRGLIVLGPTCSGPNLEGPGCSQVYADAPLVVHDASGALVVMLLKSGGDGRFVLSLPAGRYRLGVQTPKLTRCTVLEIELPAMQGQTLTIDCDTGRR